MADDIKSIVLRFTSEDNDAKGDMETLLALAAEMDHVDVDMKVNVATAGAEADLVKFLALAKLADDTDINVDVDIHNFNTAEKILRSVVGSFSDAGDSASGLGGLINDLNVNLPGFLGRLNAVSGAAFAAAVAIGVTLVGALGALIASLAAAAAGLAALAAAFAAALGPALLLVVGVVQRLAAVWKVLKQEDQAQLQSEQQRIQGSKQVASALNQQQQAAIALKRANQDLGTATAQAYREMEDAADRATHAILGLHRAQLDEEDARLGIKEAEFALKKFISEMRVGQDEASILFSKFTDIAFDPSQLNKQLAKVKVPGLTGLDREETELKLQRLILNVKEARQGEKEATENVTDAVRDKSRAEAEHIKFLEKGLKASPAYVSALRSQADAERAVARARDAVNDAKVNAAQAKTVAMTQQLSRNERILLGVLHQVRDAFKETFGPGIQSVVKGVAVSLGLVAKGIKPLKKAFTTLGDTMGAALVFLTGQLTSPKVIGQIQGFVSAATALLVPLTSLFLSLAQIFLNIATAALPLLIPVVQQVATAFAGLAASSGNMFALRVAIMGIVDQFRVWFSLLFQLGRVFFEFIKIAAPFGKSFAEHLGAAAKAMADWLSSEEGRKQVQEFLRVAVPFAEKLVLFFGKLVLFLARLGQTLAPLLSPLLDIMTAFIDLSIRVLRLIAHITEAAGALVQFFIDHVTKPLFELLGKIVDKAVQIGIDIINGIISGMKKVVHKLTDFVGDLAGKITSPFKKALSILSPSKVFAGYGENIIQGLVNGLKSGSKNLSTAVEMHLVAPTIDPMQAAVAGASGAARAVGSAPTTNGGGGDTILQVGDLVLPSPAGGGPADPRAQASQLWQELTKSARKGRR